VTHLTYPGTFDEPYHFDTESGVVAFSGNSISHGGRFGDRYGETYGDAFGFGRVRVTGAVPAGHQYIMCDYRAGYETVPADVEYVANQLVQMAYQAGLHDQALQSENLGDYSYNLADQQAFSDKQMNILRFYMREAVA